jgi:hypothetical protein
MKNKKTDVGSKKPPSIHTGAATPSPPSLPEWIRLPRPGARCEFTQLQRAVLESLILPCESNGNTPPVRSCLVKKPGAIRGCRLVHLGSFYEYCRKLSDEQKGQLQAEPSAVELSNQDQGKQGISNVLKTLILYDDDHGHLNDFLALGWRILELKKRRVECTDGSKEKIDYLLGADGLLEPPERYSREKSPGYGRFTVDAGGVEQLPAMTQEQYDKGTGYFTVQY